MMNEDLANCRCNSNIKRKFLYEMGGTWAIRLCTAGTALHRHGLLFTGRPAALGRPVLPSGAVYLFDGP